MVGLNHKLDEDMSEDFDYGNMDLWGRLCREETGLRSSRCEDCGVIIAGILNQQENYGEGMGAGCPICQILHVTVAYCFLR